MTERNLDVEIRSRIDSFLSEISSLVKEAALLSVKEALGAGTTARSAGPARGVRGAGRATANGRRGRRSSEELAEISTKVLDQLRATPGQRLEQLGQALGTPTSVLKRPVARLVADGKLRTTGQRRGMRYFTGAGRRAGGRRKKA
jgi:hypothetical protein